MKNKLEDHTVFGDQKKFGRLPAIDFRDRKFLLEIPAKMPTTGIKYYFTRPAMNQGATPQCVAYSGEQFLLSGAVVNRMYKTPEQLYKECQAVDEWEGSNYDGTSVRALFKVLQGKKFISEYRWAFNLSAVVEHVLTTGPVVFGTNWYGSMMDTDALGYIRIKSGSFIVGGHAYMVKGVNVKKQALRVINSWGRSWGQNGLAWLSFTDAERLISEAGEAATAKELVFTETTTPA